MIWLTRVWCRPTSSPMARSESPAFCASANALRLARCAAAESRSNCRCAALAALRAAASLASLGMVRRLLAQRPSGVYAPGTIDRMAHATKPARPEVKRRREAAERMRGMFAHLAPGRNLSDELIADRRAEARAEDREAAEEARRLRGKR